MKVCETSAPNFRGLRRWALVTPPEPNLLDLVRLTPMVWSILHTTVLVLLLPVYRYYICVLELGTRASRLGVRVWDGDTWKHCQRERATRAQRATFSQDPIIQCVTPRLSALSFILV